MLSLELHFTLIVLFVCLKYFIVVVFSRVLNTSLVLLVTKVSHNECYRMIAWKAVVE